MLRLFGILSILYFSLRPLPYNSNLGTFFSDFLEDSLLCCILFLFLFFLILCFPVFPPSFWWSIFTMASWGIVHDSCCSKCSCFVYLRMSYFCPTLVGQFVDMGRLLSWNSLSIFKLLLYLNFLLLKGLVVSFFIYVIYCDTTNYHKAQRLQTANLSQCLFVRSLVPSEQAILKLVCSVVSSLDSEKGCHVFISRWLETSFFTAAHHMVPCFSHRLCLWPETA